MSQDQSKSKVTFQEYKINGESPNTDSIWCYFLRATDKKSAKCKKCDKIIKTGNRSSSNLVYHAEHIHNIQLKTKPAVLVNPGSVSEPKVEQQGPAPKRTKITDHFAGEIDNSLPAVYARLASLDGFSINSIANSYDIRQGLIARGYEKIPFSNNTIRSKVIDYAKEVKNNTVASIKKLQSLGEKFSLTFDEWTSKRNRRFININLHSSSEFWNLGLVRGFGTLDAEKTLDYVSKRINSYGLTLEHDIIAIVTDGPRVMEKLGRISPTLQQMCLVHGIQLAICDVLYEKKLKDQSPQVEPEESEEPEEPESEADILDEIDEEIEGYGTFTEATYEKICPEYLPLIKKVRSFVKIFKNSPKKNEEILQKYVVGDLGKEYSLILDCKTRWSSLLNMLERFLLLKSCVSKSLIDLRSINANKKNIEFSEQEFSVLQEIVNILQPVKAVVEALCRRDANLIKARAAIIFMYDKINSFQTEISRKFLDSLKNKLSSRWNQFAEVLLYLHSGKYEENDYFTAISKKNISIKIKEIFERLFEFENGNDSSENEIGEAEIESIPSTDIISIKSQLENAIKMQIENIPTTKRENSTSILSSIKKEMALFETNGTRGYHLDLVYRALMSIQPTSVEAERAFSAAGLICTRIRTRLNDVSLDNLCFLKSYFLKKKNSLNKN